MPVLPVQLGSLVSCEFEPRYSIFKEHPARAELARELDYILDAQAGSLCP